jgi:zinc/manganese transport system substrate-binding protein
VRLTLSKLLGPCVASLLLFGGAIGAACGNGPSDTRPKVVATTIQMGALTKAVAGDTVNLTTLVGAGVDPHDFEPSAGDVQDVGDATLVIRQGIGIDTFLDGAITGSGQKNVVTVSTGVPLRKGTDETGHADDDPHVWQDPQNDKIMVANIANALSAAFPVNAATYQRNAVAYERKLDEVDRQIAALIDALPSANRKMVTNHDAFGYFMARYGLQFVGAVIPGLSTSAEPSAKEIAALEDTIRREGVKAIFAESSLDPKVAAQIAKDTGARIVDDLYGDSLGASGSGADTVDGMLLANARKIVDALK